MDAEFETVPPDAERFAETSSDCRNYIPGVHLE
jgi:hypothetical protein